MSGWFIFWYRKTDLWLESSSEKLQVEEQRTQSKTLIIHRRTTMSGMLDKIIIVVVWSLYINGLNNNNNNQKVPKLIAQRKILCQLLSHFIGMFVSYIFLSLLFAKIVYNCVFEKLMEKTE